MHALVCMIINCGIEIFGLMMSGFQELQLANLVMLTTELRNLLILCKQPIYGLKKYFVTFSCSYHPNLEYSRTQIVTIHHLP